MPSLEARLARNEVLFRAINERIRELVDRFEHVGNENLAFICECADETCAERIMLKASQYDEVRAIPARFIVAPGHEATPLVERVIFQNSDFAVVRKIGLAAEIARGLIEPS